MNPLLVELFVEELPPKALKVLGEAFAEVIARALLEQGLRKAGGVVTGFASPRRLAVHVTEVLAQAPDKAISTKLMPAAVGLDAQGQASAALVKKLAALGVEVGTPAAVAQALARLRREGEGKQEALWLDSVAPGVSLAQGLQKALEAALAALPIPKVMSYQLADGWSTVNFVRPVHGLVALHGEDVVPVSVLGLSAGCETHGHRFEARHDPIVLRSADSYAQQLLEEGAVIASFAERHAEIARQLLTSAQAAGARTGQALHPVADEALLDEVTALVERPNVLIGQFEADFLQVPQECLILTMKANQKYFPLLDAAGRLSNQFLIVSNVRPHDPAAVIQGNERVVRPRLADARFFLEQDRKKPLSARVAGLAKVVYHNKLGSQGERCARVERLARELGQALGNAALAESTARAATLAKADLLTDMVGEFPELQGVMGRYYALHDGEPPAVADALEDHYKPRFAGDSLPRGQVGLLLALADKLETLAGLFGIGQQPSGDKDPFALRRHALGVVRILREGGIELPLDMLLERACACFEGVAGYQPPHALLTDFIFERLANNLREQGYSAQEVDAVVSLRPQRLSDVAQRLAAVRAFAALPEAQSLAAANKRVGNILKKSETVASAAATNGINPALLREPAEQALHAALLNLKPQADAAFERGDYTASLKHLAALKEPVDHFFDDVMVNAEDPALRTNRLALLATLHQTMNRVADLSKLSA